MRPEMHWGESSFGQNVKIKQCLFDAVGFIHNAITNPEQACIRIQGTSDVASEKTLPIRGITIEGCKFTNNEQRYAIWLNSAQSVTIKNNVFDKADKTQLPDTDGTAVLLDTCMNVEISGNVYNYESYNGNAANVIGGKNYKNVFGSDVTDDKGNCILP
jgi:hypothetical protein